MAVKIDVEKANDDVVEFTLTGLTTAQANALRRIAIASLPVFAVDSVTFYENDSALSDEYIAHRIALVPITTPDGFDEKDVVLFALDAEGPKTVYSKSMKSNEAKVSVANEGIPIMVLGGNQRLRLEAKARLGNGREHAKFQPGLVTYGKEGDSYRFYVESFGAMSAKDMVVKAVEILEEKLEEFGEALKKAIKEAKE